VRTLLRALLLLLALGVMAGSIVGYSIASRGLSTRVKPSAIE
jgi:hypothetical protein